MHIRVRVVWWLLELSSQSALKYLKMYYCHWCFPVVFIIFAMVVVVAWKINVYKLLLLYYAKPLNSLRLLIDN